MRDSAAQVADENRRMFDRIAARYDRLNAVLSLGLHRRWGRRAVAALEPAPGGRYLDVGCGTADVAVEILRRQPGARVVGIDPSERMLSVGRAKVARAHLAQAVTLQAGDATQMGFADASFDGAISAYCLRNVAARERALAEMRRVVAPGGHVVVLELTVPHAPLPRLAHALFTRTVVPLAGQLLAGSRDAYRYLVDSIRDFPPPGRVVEMLAEAGLRDAAARPLHAGIVTLFTGTVA